MLAAFVIGRADVSFVRVFVACVLLGGGVQAMCGCQSLARERVHPKHQRKARRQKSKLRASEKRTLISSRGVFHRDTSTSTSHLFYTSLDRLDCLVNCQLSSAKMDSSRIFIKGLPPSITEADFKKHFSAGGREVTDARLFANRRIGYVGYKTPEDAQSAVKYFNKTFVRMSRIGVEVARPIGESNPGRAGGRAPTAPKESQQQQPVAPAIQDNSASSPSEDDPKLKEYLEVMNPKSKKRSWENDETTQTGKGDAVNDDEHMAVDAAAASDEEYEDVPRKAKKAKVEPSTTEPQAEETPAEVVTAPTENPDQPNEEKDTAGAPMTDADWARSRTSRLLGLLDDDEEEEESSRPKARAMSASSEEMDHDVPTKGASTRPTAEIPAPTSNPAADEPAAPDADVEPTGVRASMRLFVRNLPYGVQEDALRSEFVPYGNVEEVRFTYALPLSFSR